MPADEAGLQKNPWLRSFAWDGFWMLSGLWLLAPLFVFANTPRFIQKTLLVTTLTLWISHRLATTYNAFCVPAYRELTRLQRTRFIVWPLSAVLATFAFVFLPFPLAEREKIQVLGTIFFLYNSYHFGIQHYGVLSIYRIRAGQGPSGWQRYERTYCWMVGAVLVAVAQVCQGSEMAADTLLYRFLPPGHFQPLFHFLRAAVLPLVGGMTAVFYAVELRNRPVSLPKLLYATGLMLQGILAYFLPPLSFLVLWAVQHYLVSLALCGHMSQNGAGGASASSHWYGFWSRLNKGFWPSILFLAAVSTVLAPFFHFAPHPEKVPGGANSVPILALLVTSKAARNLFIAMNFSTFFVHFFMDRAVFRFSDPDTRKVTTALLFAPRVRP